MTIEEAVSAILARRGIPREQPLSSFPPPRRFPGAVEAGQALASALMDGKRILVWGDYDVDGVTSTALFLRFCQKVIAENGFPATVDSFIPDRFADGYGVNAKRLKKFSVDIIFTVDCGIAAFEAAEEAGRLGIPLVITDHHLPENGIPEALAVCDPALLPEKEAKDFALAGVGVIFVVARACSIALSLAGFKAPDVRSFLDLVALGMIADVSWMAGEGRSLVKAGMRLLASGRSPGIAALKRVSGLAYEDPVDSETVGFQLGPRLNAAGRMKHANLALSLLMEDDPDTAFQKALALDDLNRNRKETEKAVVREASSMARDFPGASGLVLTGSWHHGVLGIAASRIAETFGVPALLCAPDAEGLLRGSGRSAGGIPLYEALSLCPSLSGFGGHAMAAGVRFKKENIDDLRREFSDACAKLAGNLESGNHPEMTADAEVDALSLNPENIRALSDMEPFGEGNPQPVFLSEPLRILGYRQGPVLLSLELGDGRDTVRGRIWRPESPFPDENVGRMARFFYSPKLSCFGGRIAVEIDVYDWVFLFNN